MPKKLGFVAILIVFGIFAFFVSTENYKKHWQIRMEYVKHPENLPSPEVAKRSTFGFSNVIADKYWLQSIQYIGGNAISSEYKLFLFAMLNLITSLNPYFEHPYILGMLLLPGHNEMYEDFSKEEQKEYTLQAEALGLKGIENFCDPEIIEAIANEYDLQKIWSDPEFANPCSNDMIPYSLAFVYYFYLDKPLEAAKYYKVSSAIEGSIEGAKVMSAIMQGKGGEREKAIYMFLNMARNIDANDQTCNTLSLEIEKVMNGLKNGSVQLSGGLLAAIANTREELFGEFNEETKEIALSDTSCQNYVNKAVREMNLLYLDLANKAYMKREGGKPAENSKVLLDAGLIDREPVDFQQYEDYGIAYEFNEKIGNFDYANAAY